MVYLKAIFLFYKWICFFVWGGIYLLVQGAKKRDKLWITIGIEFVIVTVTFVILVIVLLNGHSLERITAIFGILIFVNLAPLIWYIKNNKDIDYSNDI